VRLGTRICDHANDLGAISNLLAGVAVASAVAVDLVVVLAASVCWLSTVEASLTEAPAPSLLHVEVKMALVGFIGTRSEHGAEDAAGLIVD
jgi:hypothetical protein